MTYLELFSIFIIGIIRLLAQKTATILRLVFEIQRFLRLLMLDALLYGDIRELARAALDNQIQSCTEGKGVNKVLKEQRS